MMVFPVVKSASICFLFFRRAVFPKVLLAMGQVYGDYINKISSVPDNRAELIISYQTSHRAGSVILVCFLKKLTVSYDPLHGGWPKLYGHLLFAYACGNRERFYDDDGVVEMFFSYYNVLRP
jgi:hypothetical protein